MQNLDHNSYAWQWSERFHERVTINGGNFYSKCQAVSPLLIINNFAAFVLAKV